MHPLRPAATKAVAVLAAVLVPVAAPAAVVVTAPAASAVAATAPAVLPGLPEIPGLTEPTSTEPSQEAYAEDASGDGTRGKYAPVRGMGDLLTAEITRLPADGLYRYTATANRMPGLAKKNAHVEFFIFIGGAGEAMGFIVDYYPGKTVPLALPTSQPETCKVTRATYSAKKASVSMTFTQECLAYMHRIDFTQVSLKINDAAETKNHSTDRVKMDLSGGSMDAYAQAND